MLEQLQRASLIVLLALAAASCSASSSGAAGGGTPCGATKLNLGGTTGGIFCQAIAPAPINSNVDNFCFDNTSLNFSDGDGIGENVGLPGLLVDTGSTCASAWPGGGSQTVAQASGDNYIGRFPDGSLIRFHSGAYDGNNVAITYDYVANSSNPKGSDTDAGTASF